jgi:hypothetical protein
MPIRTGDQTLGVRVAHEAEKLWDWRNRRYRYAVRRHWLGICMRLRRVNFSVLILLASVIVFHRLSRSYAPSSKGIVEKASEFLWRRTNGLVKRVMVRCVNHQPHQSPVFGVLRLALYTNGAGHWNEGCPTITNEEWAGAKCKKKLWALNFGLNNNERVWFIRAIAGLNIRSRLPSPHNILISRHFEVAIQWALRRIKRPSFLV